ncbi:archaeal proteasome endopeptidase complex subunit alpha [Candidatus Woesearchaeota archaeon]|nr:archaeal proteasome endopeptidase complex subunit alpha [Candidatus Woesearchaeota archaeon]
MEINHQMMGYDRAITMFSPDGRLLQVEYARKMVKQGSTAIGLVCKEGVVLITDKRLVDKLVVPEAVEKIWQVDEHIGATAAGMISDARVLIERAQLKAQQHRLTYDTPIDVLSIVKDVCNIKQICTQSGGLRPFGISLLIVGVDDDGPKLFETDPAGIYFRYHAKVIGEGETEVMEILYNEYKSDLTLDDALKLGVRALVKVLGKNVTSERLDCTYIKIKERQFTRLSEDKVDRLLKEAKRIGKP